MEKQRSFSIKPIRYLVFTFTISFSVIFLIFFFTWVFKTAPSSHIDTHSIRFNSSSLLHSLRGVDNSPPENVSQSSISMGTHYREDGVSSRVAEVSIFDHAQERENETAAVAGNFSLTSLVQSLSVDSVNASINRESAVDSVNSTPGDKEMQNLIDGLDSNFSEKLILGRNKIEEKNKGVCDITNGKWIIDESYPLYTNASCPFIDEGFNCDGNGRLDKDYMKWKWKPQDCNIPRFNATNMLELIRGKRLVFVGDSLNRNQWESMLCLLMGAVKDPKKVYETHHRKITKERGDYCFKFEEYKCTVEYYVTHFLVHESKARVGKKRVQTLRIDTVDKGSSRWRGADILVFNTAHWWNHHKTKAG